MKTRSEVSAAKLRGGFYSPPALVSHCLDRIQDLTEGRSDLKVLEPSAGDGAFVRGLDDHVLASRVDSLTAVELLDQEASKCAAALAASNFPGRVIRASAITWALEQGPVFDAAVGNPPFVRFQFVAEEEKAASARLADDLDLPLARVGNLWIPLLLASLTRLREGGAFAFIVPAECFTGTSARAVRTWLADNVEGLRFDLFAPASFPGVLQEVVVMSGRRASPALANGATVVAVCDHTRSADEQIWRHRVSGRLGTWTGLLLTPRQVSALDEAATLSAVATVGSVARFEVAAVTGANDYFCVKKSVLEHYELEPWALPLLPRVRHAEGLRYTGDDYETTIRSGAKAFLLVFSEERPDPILSAMPRRYLEIGKAAKLHTRYKCRIREPWYRVPHIRTEPMMLSKRSHYYPRVLVNEAKVVTTDTIYRGYMLPGAQVDPHDFAAGFHNSLTLLSAELEGRSFGGGVLELVPSEVGRLLVPVVAGIGSELPSLDIVARTGTPAQLVEQTNDLLAQAGIGLSADLLAELSVARHTLAKRRLDRTSSSKRSAKGANLSDLSLADLGDLGR